MKNVFSSLFVFDSDIIDEEGIMTWLATRNKANEFVVNQIDFDKLNKWNFHPETGYLQHESGKFFSIEGLKVKTDFGNTRDWEQVIINQPEVGILGIITKIIGGTRYFLMQAKMEPGNINILQISPTLQATRSNYKLAHKGKVPLYLEYFTERSRSKIVIDQLQSEQGGRFLKKRNRNMIVEVEEEIEVHDDFCWMTLGQIKRLMQYDNIINMDARSVISCIPFQQADDKDEAATNENADQRMIRSLTASNDDLYTLEEQLSWINEQKLSYNLEVQRVPLPTLTDWVVTGSVIKHASRSFFEVIAVDVQAGNREVGAWTQPLIRDKNPGLIGFVIKEIKGKFYFLVQAKVEPGNIDVVDMAPTVSVSNYANLSVSAQPVFFDSFISGKQEILYDKIHSEEGGRFYHLQNRYMMVIDNDLNENELPENFRFMTLEQILTLSQFGFFNIESRGLISCIDYFKL